VITTVDEFDKVCAKEPEEKLEDNARFAVSEWEAILEDLKKRTD